jgi:preprotein translocase subunit SecA
VDEVDSVLIDEAQTPLIIANSVKTSIDKYIIATEVTDYLEVNKHFEIDEKK